jgi:hypothetical protein
MNWITSSYSGYNGNCVQAAWAKSSHSVLDNCVEMAWDKSSHSTANGHCVEAAWAKSSYSPMDNCVETAHGECELVHVRDSKDVDAEGNHIGSVLSFSREDWTAFLATIKAQV